MTKDKGKLVVNDSCVPPGLPELGEINQDVITDMRFRNIFQKLKMDLQTFTKEWNSDETNRDKAV